MIVIVVFVLCVFVERVFESCDKLLEVVVWRKGGRGWCLVSRELDEDDDDDFKAIRVAPATPAVLGVIVCLLANTDSSGLCRTVLGEEGGHVVEECGEIYTFTSEEWGRGERGGKA